MADKSNFLDFLLNSMPMSFEMFNYFVWVNEDGGYYINLGMSPLYKEWVKKPFRLETEIGRHYFVGESSEPVFMCDAFLPECTTYSTGSEVITATMLGQTKSITYHRGMKKEIESSFKMKVENGVLFKKKDGQWIQNE